ncbi:MAG: extensin family protein [Deltaproteobacteria bacterium]|nr:extensin family protein [Deltaproteobacteria bacterium]
MTGRALAFLLAVLVAVEAPAPASAHGLATVADGRATASTAAARPAKSKTQRKRSSKRRQRSRGVTSSIDATTTPAYRYGQLTQDACESELVTRGISFTREPARGVLAPVRLTGALRGVEYRTRLSAERRETTPWEIADCRLVLALDDLAQLLAQHDIVEVRHYSMWRPPRASWPEGKAASQHAGALALDAGQFVDRAGQVIDVDDDWHGRIGAKTCGPKARPRQQTPEALKLRAILCDAAAARLFNVILTPNHNRGHKNHFHLDLTPGVTWFIVD